MACAKKCDRCGKLYEQYNSKNDRKNPNGIMVLYPYCVLLRDTRNGVRTCPGYNTLSLMLRGSEASE